MNRKIRIGTRGSKLALYQAVKVQENLLAAFPRLQPELVIIKTLGDRRPELNLLASEARGVFCGDIERALLEHTIDLAVHSVKDLPGELPAGLALAGFLVREDPREVLVTRDGCTVTDLPPGARIGTSSIRRLLQLRQLRQDLEFQAIRGNVETRIRKVMDNQYDATILALAGIRRLELAHYAAQIFPVEEMVPAPGQGCIGMEIRADDCWLRELVSAVTHRETALELRAERAFLKRMGGRCRSAYGAVARWDKGFLSMLGLYGDESGDALRQERLIAPEAQAEALGLGLAEKLLDIAKSPRNF